MSAPQPSAVAAGASGAALSDPIDRAVLAQLAQLDPGGSHQIVRRVLETYQRSLIRSMAEFAQARSTGDLVTVGRLSHTLRSSSASVGAMELSNLCRQVEGGVRDGQGDGLPQWMDSLQSESVRVQAALEVMLDLKGSVP